MSVRRVLGLVVVLACALGMIALTWPGVFRLERTFPIAQVLAFRVFVALGFAALAVVFLLFCFSRRTRPVAFALVVVCLVGAGGNAVTLAMRGFSSDELPAKTAGSVRVMTWNTAGSIEDPSRVAQIAVGMDADIVALPETNARTGEAIAIAMRGLGRPMWVHDVDAADWDAGKWDATRTTLLISPDLGDYSVIRSSQDGTSTTTVVPSAVAMPVDGNGPTIVAVHAVAPREAYAGEWDADLRWIADQCASSNVILAGDFNATVDHFAGLGTNGGQLGDCTDSASEAGAGAVGTWPTSLPALVGAPIDHVMHTPNWTVAGAIVLRTLDDAGSDHRPLIVQLDPVG